MNTYFRIGLLGVSSSLEDLLTEYCFQAGALGVTEALAFSQPDLTYDPDLLPMKTRNMDVYFAARPAESFFQGLKERAPTLAWEVHEEENKDWLAEWKKGFLPFQLVDRYWVVPSWCQSPVAPEHTIFIDPGMAFGTGTHATTKMASYFVHKICAGLPDAEGTTLLDVGTGTAILAMLAHHHKVGQIMGIEIDPEARRVARENVKLNNMSDIQVPDLLIEEVEETFDIVVANIIDGVLLQIKPHLLQAMNPGGHLFLTGILLEREPLFFEKFIENSGLKVIRRLEQDEWVGYWLQS